MAQETNSEGADPEVERLKRKTEEGAANLVGSILDNPEVQKIIKKALGREVIVQALVMSCFFIGILKIYDVGKQVLGFGWQIELVISLVLVLIGLIYMAKNVFNGKRNGK